MCVYIFLSCLIIIKKVLVRHLIPFRSGTRQAGVSKGNFGYTVMAAFTLTS